MTLPCPHLDQLERSEDHVNSWHRPRRHNNSPGFGPKHKHFATAAIFDTAGKPHTAGRTFGVPISRITYARRRRGPRTRLEYHSPGLPLPPPVEDTALGTASRPATLKTTGRAAEDQKKECWLESRLFAQSHTAEPEHTNRSRRCCKPARSTPPKSRADADARTTTSR